MSRATGYEPHHNPNGRREVECAWCGVKFRTNRSTAKYCCYKHKEMAGNRRFYTTHRKEIILATMLRQIRGYQKQKARRREKEGQLDPEQMTNEELLEWVRTHPHEAMRKKR